ncbi:MAG: 3'(2'),5'-bisphosphate nucleotidase [Deltaproteobacteria bacterium]|nr:3'(2'),5'-bisphosphate nucleotidase [Deltaproteobacteria bacterium]
MAYEEELRIAVESVALACRLCRRVRSVHLARDVIRKEDLSPVTVADFGSQALVGHCLQTAFPEDPLVAEENSLLLREEWNAQVRRAVIDHVSHLQPGLGEQRILGSIDRGGAEGGSSGRFWTLDPIDGTKGFLRGDQYAVALALLEEGRVVLGVLGCPNLSFHPQDAGTGIGTLFAAIRGRGTGMRDLETGKETSVRVSDLDDPSRALFCEPYESNHSSHGRSVEVMEVLGIRKPPVRMDGQGKYALVARGEADLYMRLPTEQSYEEKIWDHAAGALIVEEAGGRATDLDNRPLDFRRGRTLAYNRGIIVSNGRIHERVLEAVERVLSRPASVGSC